MQPFALVILGPTATGKTSLALQIAAAVKSEIISMDSALIYRGMDIGTAKPSKEELALVPHHLIDICDPAESYSAASFAQDCVRLIEEISARGALPIICGGTMLYYKALTEGLSPLPPTDEQVREQIRKEGETLGWPALHQRLRGIDPLLFDKYSPNDKQRISRALEVFAMTGRPLTSFYAHKTGGCPYPLLEFVLLPPEDRTALREVIRERFVKMAEPGGIIDETRALMARGDLNLNLPSMRCVGYRQAWQFLLGELTYDEFIERGVIATAQLAKHQMTWLRGALKDEKRIKLKPHDEKNADLILQRLQERLGSALPLRNQA
ncbi:MAG: tRNA (adenosine(37)-N6)-dimethylallyltransferase MiaA [Proteobacteria bacterium]|uniref:tRNA dimethylallyltransferase n=1 Tax=Candidatus Avisuccinivibrio stercorigallinarum TaxID=2840704 RepID=A0A9D9GTQ0_9GAMM|nr:tRNA (adenosine(37)-N6)-dimethylallyltransferase MiaA [Candidatus Avisuccinivibrio stercorigallinarum]